MTKVQHISGITKRLLFEDLDFYELFRITFEMSELGRMKRLLPLHEMAVNFGLVSNRKERRRGPKPFFSPEGKVALMFLKMHTGLSAPKLLEQLNGKKEPVVEHSFGRLSWRVAGILVIPKVNLEYKRGYKVFGWIDLHVECVSVPIEELSSAPKGESSATIRERVIKARHIQEERFKGVKGIHCNAQMNSTLLHKYAHLDAPATNC